MSAPRESTQRIFQTKQIRCLIFDLDGTLIDSSDDIYYAVNRVLQERLLPPLPKSQILSFIGKGVHWLVQQVLSACHVDEVDLQIFKKRLMEIYSANSASKTVVYPGVHRNLKQLAQTPLKMAICTNKPEELARSILEELGIHHYFIGLLGGESLSKRKPSPEPLQFLMELFEVRPEQTLMIGDSVYDIIAGKAAQCWTCAAAYGFQSSEKLRQETPDLWIEEFSELWTLLYRNDMSKTSPPPSTWEDSMHT
ncbi:MAG: phosphoglycolate phosphatase [Myxococcota bacterium]